MQHKIDTYIDFILSNKALFFGMAMLLVIMSHLIHTDPGVKIWWIFYPGFIGVDIFMFFSGYGLCRSYENNSLPQFYYHRFKRIYPMYFIFALAICCIYIWKEAQPLPLIEWIYSVTTLSFWGFGHVVGDWYLSFSMFLYLLFPIMYLLTKKIGVGSVVIALMCVFPILIWGHINWVYECALARVPIFMMGIACATHSRSETYTYSCIAFGIALLAGIVLVYLGLIQKYILVYMFAPFFMLILAFVTHPLTDQSRLKRVVCYLGTISLELYIANILTCGILPNLSIETFRSVWYVAMQAGIAAIFVLLNKCVSSLFLKIETK